MPSANQTGNNSRHTSLIICAAVYCLLCVGLGVASSSYASIKLPQFAYFLVIANILWLFALYRLRFINGLSIRFVLFWSVLFRLCLLPAFPVLENDIFRYLWDGYMLVRHHAVYGILPSQFYPGTGVEEAMRPILDLLAYPDVPTVYGPVAQLVFAGAYLVSPGEIWPFKLMVVSADIGVLLMLSRRLSPEKLLLFSWCPLILFQFALNAHIDILAVLFIMAAVCIDSRPSRWWSAPVLLVLATGCKVFSLLAVPFILHHWRQRVIFAVLLLTGYLPIVLTGHSEFEGLAAMAREWAFNSFWYTNIALLINDTAARAGGMAVFVFGAVMIYRYYGGTDLSRGLIGCFAIYTLLLLTIPALNPWYLLWVLFFALFTSCKWPWVFAVSIWLSLLTGINLQTDKLDLYEVPLVVLWLEYGIVLVAALWFDRHKSGVNPDKAA